MTTVDDTLNTPPTDPPASAATELPSLVRALSQLVAGSAEAALQLLLDAIPDPIWLKDREGVFLFCNTAFERLYGAPRRTIVGKTDYDFVDAELADFFRENDRKSVLKGQPSVNEEWLTFAEDGYHGLFETIKTPLFDAQGGHIGVLGIARDITKLHEAQARLRERQAMLETIVRLAGSAIALIDPDNARFIEFNEAAYRMLGYSREAFAELTLLDIEAEHPPQQVLGQLQQIVEQGGMRIETRHRHRDGHLLDVVISTSVLELQGRCYIEALWTDVTAIRQAGRAARRREALLMRTEQLAHVGSWEWRREDDQVSWSDEMFRIYQRDPALGAPAFAEQERLGLYQADDFARLKAAVEAALATGESYAVEVRINRPDGSQRIALAYGEPERDDAGELVGLTGYVRDITEQRRVEQALRNSESELARAQQVARLGSWSINVATGELRWSDETYRIFGRVPGSPVDYASFLEHVYPEDAARVDAAWQRALQGEPYDIRHRIRVGGQVRWVHERAALETDADGRLVAGIGTVQEITVPWREHLLLETGTHTLRLLAQGGSLADALEVISRGVETINPDLLASIMLLEGDRLHIGAAPRLPSALRAGLDGVALNSGITCARAAASARLAVCADLAGDPHWQALGAEVMAAGLHGCWARPVLSREGEVLGVFALYYAHTGEPTVEDRELVEQLAGLVRQVIEQARAREALRLASRVIEYSHSAIIVTDARGNIVAVNPAFTEMTGYSEEEVLGHNPRLLKSGWQSDAFYQHFWQSLNDEGYWRGELWNRRKDGSYFALWLTASAVRDQHGQITHYIGISDDITDNKAAMDRIEFLAYHDSLTELPNRQLARDRMEQVIARSRRDSDSHFALLFVDLDQFKAVNDALGHTVGDGLIRAAAQRLKETVRETDTVSRQGGDEFLIMLTGEVEMHAVSAVCAKLLETLARPFTVDGHVLSISASIGVAMYPDDGEDFDTLMKKADMAMYSAKDAGRNAYRFYTEQMNADVMDRILLRNGLLRALEHNEFVLHYQPQVDLASGRVIGLEALIRWHHPELGMVPPDRFIAVAESSGLIVEIGSWVLQEACRQMRQWRDELGLDEVIMAVNISVLQFTRGDLLQAVQSALEASGLPPSMLELELTESVLLREADQALEIMQQLRALGVKMSIDDFGTGYSSLSYLKQLPVDKLKIDRSFVKDVIVDADDAAIAHAVISLAHILGLSVIAEGVESADQLAFLQTRSCDQYQGYFFSRPLPATECSSLLARAVQGLC